TGSPPACARRSGSAVAQWPTRRRAVRRWCSPDGLGPVGGAVATRCRTSIEQPEQRRYHGCRLRPVADVLTGEGGLVHLGTHVARVNGVDPKVGLLGGEDRAELIERGLGRAVAAPTRVGL